MNMDVINYTVQFISSAIAKVFTNGNNLVVNVMKGLTWLHTRAHQ